MLEAAVRSLKLRFVERTLVGAFNSFEAIWGLRYLVVPEELVDAAIERARGTKVGVEDKHG